MQIVGMSAVVTGGASGLGAATAGRLHALGAQVVIADIDAERGQAAAERLGRGAAFVRTDVTDAASVQAAIDQARSVAPLGVLTCCAGVAIAERVIGRESLHSLERFARVVSVNLIGTFNAVRAAGDAMRQNTPNGDGERGVAICTASVAAYEGQIGQAAYSASKGGVVGMILPIAREFASFGVRVCGIAPGIFDTPMLAGLPEAARASLGQQVPFPSRLGRPAEYAELAAAIIENPMLNGSVIRLDGAIRLAPR